jgi:hypothetical protein
VAVVDASPVALHMIVRVLQRCSGSVSIALQCFHRADLACSAKRFPTPLFSELLEACTNACTNRRAHALPALARVACKWPVQPVCWRFGRAVAAVDEAFLVVCAASSDLDMAVRVSAALSICQLTGAADKYVELAMKKKGTLQVDAASSVATNIAQLPTGDEKLLDSASGMLLEYSMRLVLCVDFFMLPRAA